MTDKTKGYKAPPRTKTEQENAEIETLETAEPALVPDPEVSVPTGDEPNPVSQPTHSDGLKTLFDKARKNREALISRDGEDADVAMIQALNAEAAGGRVEGADIDTNQPDRFEQERAEELAAAELIADEAGDGEEEEIPEVEIVNEVVEEEEVSLSDADLDARVSVKILGQFYDVPQQDVDDAGGIENYQKNRAATIRIQRAATLEQRALQALEDVKTQPPPEQPVADPSTDGHGEADIDSSYEELMDTVINGDEAGIKKWLKGQREAHIREPVETPTPEPETPSPAVSSEPVVTETQQELQRQYKEDMEATNTMMNEEYSDIMQGATAQATKLQRRRLADAQDKFQSLVKDPHNEGRSQVDMAREAAHIARKIVYAEEDNSPVPPIELERRTRIEKKKRYPKTSRADRAAPAANRTQENKPPTRKEHMARLRRASGHPD